ncbi:MAG: DUF2007 domain-containing protein [Myxococcota bacterium]|nr:DUF2007 domain-containing protein [Myxococcota bacterium]
MQMTALVTVFNPAAAEIVADAVRDLGIPVEVHRVRGDRYLGTLVDVLYEVRVAEQHLAEARRALRLLEQEAEWALADQTGVLADPEDGPGHEAEVGPRHPAVSQPEDSPAVALRRRRTSHVAASAMLSLLGGLALVSLYRHGCAFAHGPPVPRSALPRHHRMESAASRMEQQRQRGLLWGAACAPQIVCLPASR